MGIAAGFVSAETGRRGEYCRAAIDPVIADRAAMGVEGKNRTELLIMASTCTGRIVTGPALQRNQAFSSRKLRLKPRSG